MDGLKDIFEASPRLRGELEEVRLLATGGMSQIFRAKQPALDRFVVIKKLKAAKFTRNNYDTLLDEIYTESRLQLKQMQDDYDGQTKNGQLKNIQTEWNDKIEKQLKLLSIN